ncbi:MAG: hypothetical protein ABIN69_03880 [Aestuariivirga sp.]
MKTAVQWMFLLPVGFLIAYFLKGHNPSFISQESWDDGLLGGCGATFGLSLTGIMQNLREAIVSTALEAKIFNEQIKLMATSLNAMALAILIFSVVQPIVNRLQFEWRDAFLFLMGIFIHTRSYAVLGCMKADPE